MARVGSSRAMDKFGRCFMEIEAGQPVFYREPACSACGGTHRMKIGAGRHPSPEFLNKRLRHQGWRADKRLVCPDCVVARRGETEPEPQPESPMPTPARPDPVSVAAAIPRAPTPAERRAVREALYDHYLEERGCYRQAFSDKSLAAKLDVPAKWVSDMREALGFGPDANEASEAFLTEIAAITDELSKLSDEFLTRVGALEQRAKRLEVDRAYRSA